MFPACLTTMVLTLSLVWYTHSVIDSRQHAPWQDREISLHCARACYFHAAGDTLFKQGQFIQYPGRCIGPMWTISLNMPHKCRFPYAALTIFKSPHKQLQHHHEPNQMSNEHLFIHNFHDVLLLGTPRKKVQHFMRKDSPQHQMLQCCTFLCLWLISAKGNQLKNQWNDVHQIVYDVMKWLYVINKIK